jgi:hypothetical protein
MGIEQSPLNWEDFETQEEYEAALKRRAAEDMGFFSGGMGMMPNAMFIGSSGYAPRAWGEPKKKPKKQKKGGTGGSGNSSGSGAYVPDGEYWY